MKQNCNTPENRYKLSTGIAGRCELRATLFVLLFILASSFYAQQTYSFTTCGATGKLGPTQTQVTNTYSSTNLAGSVTVALNGIQQWVVPNSGLYRITVAGAKGGDGRNASVVTVGGSGAIVRAELNLTGGQTLQIVCGQIGISSTSADTGGGGGGGSFVSASGTPLIIAGGGGAGADNAPTAGGTTGTTSTSGLQGNNTGGVGGTGGSGGNGNGTSGGGGGYTTNGTTAAGGLAFLNGADGGPGTYGDGGFGGGGGGSDASLDNGGGGGGYSGGGAGGSDGAGGGGGSFIAASGINLASSNGLYNGTAVTNIGSFNTGQGYVIFEGLCSISLSVSGANSSGAICTGNSVTLTTNAVSNYVWSTGATTSSIIVSPTATTIYTLSATSVSACNASSSTTVTVSQGSPTLTLTNSTSGTSNGVCTNGTATLTASGAITYTWTGSISNGISFTPTAASGYTVSGQNACGITTAVTSVSIHPSPTLSAISVVNPTMCTGTNNTLTATGSGISTYLWSTSSTASFITVSPTANTNYTVTATSALGCTNTAATTVTVFTTPLQVPVASPAVLCLGQSSTLTAVGSSFTWSPGGASTASIIVSPTNTGVQTFTVIKANGACADTKTLTVTVNGLPIITAQALPTVVCQSVQSATLSGSGATNYTWAPAGGTASAITVTASANIIYTLTGSSGGCIGTNTVLLDVAPLPTIVATASSPSICIGDVVTLSVTGGVSYSWSPVSSGSSSFIDVPTGPTQYSVIGTNTAGCSSSSGVFVMAYPVPTLNVSTNNPVVCLGNQAVVTVSGANTYSWSSNSTATSATVIPTQATTYSVKGTYTLGNCSSTGTVMVDVLTPSIAITGNTVICEGGTASLTANASGATSYSWSTGLPIQTILVSPASSTVYVVTVTVSALNITCNAINSVPVIVNANPTIVPIADRLSMCVHETVAFAATGGTAYTWSWGSQSANTTTIAITPTVITILVVNLTGTGTNGCTNTGSVVVTANTCNGINEASLDDSRGILIYPNPNNGDFTVRTGEELSLKLMNALGQEVKEFSLDASNDYKITLSGLPQGIYFIVSQNTSYKVIVDR